MSFFQQSECTYTTDYSGATQRGVIFIDSGDESALMAAVYSMGPIAVAVDGRSNAFKVSQEELLFLTNQYSFWHG